MSIYIIIWILFGIFGAKAAEDKGRNKIGWGILVFICPLALVIVLCLKDLRKQ